ncbi:TIGR02186 family protein [Kordiimonas aquimaris]|uniref:TIGR02186 family protein n=1 Tax=Kordiimonas aquimaris TaxID=707591 RepID=UPI0021D06749|nr:TIGR02186 family protein [Kordiimonas aquimaris]
MRALCMMLLIVFGANLAPAYALVTDLSNKRIEIRYSFNGADLILFGAIGSSAVDPTRDDFDVVIVVRGPEAATVVRQKEKVGLIWINNQELLFPSAPGYYAVAASRPLSEIATKPVFESYGIGFDYLPLLAHTERGLAEPKAGFRKALFRLQSAQGLYRQEQDDVTHVGEGLFKTDIRLPANVPVGDFIVETFIFQKGTIKARNRIMLNVDKEGFERAAYDYAHDYPFWYGITAVLVALSAGWLAGVLGKK